jgi:hypothetical protein
VPRATEPWAEAFEEATRRGLGYLGTDLLLLGLARTDGISGEVLTELGATPDAIEAVVDTTAVPDPRASGEADRPPYPKATPAAEHARGRAHGLAIGLGQSQRQVHLLLALAYDRHGVHAHVLRRLGVHRSALVARLAERGVVVPAEPPPPDPAPKSEAVVLPREQADVVLKVLIEGFKERQELFIDQEGEGRWGYGAVEGQPDETRIIAEPVVGLRAIVPDALRAAGFPEPPESAWEPGESGPL